MFVGSGRPQPERGHVQRVGDTARRPAHARSWWVQQLLDHLATVGFDGAPKPLGIDHLGQEVVTWIEGEVPDRSPFDLSDPAVRSTMMLIRRFHDATVGSAFAGAGEVVVHGDLGPHNTVYRDGLAVALIDFDADVAGGLRLDDVAHAVWCTADITEPTVDLATQSRRLHLACDAYGDVAPNEVLDALARRFERARRQHRAAGREAGVEIFGELLAWLSHHRMKLVASSANVQCRRQPGL